MDAGKLPHDLLASLLQRVHIRDPRVLIGPGIGRDAAVIDTGAPKLLVAKSDPITFASDLIGWYAVHVNANDIACTGARPQWFLATVLLPQGSAPELAESIFGQLIDACDSLSIELVGGHTEVSAELAHPIIAGAMLGEVDGHQLVRPDGARPGDALILTKGIAIEGTGLLAREVGGRLARLGVSQQDIDAAARYILDPGISVLKEAMAACDVVRVHAMHDPTEGGLATALYEMAEASNCGITFAEDALDILPLTNVLCTAAALDPLGLVASGAMLIAVAEDDLEPALRAIEREGISARHIGSLASKETGVIMKGKRGRRPLPHFPRDEVARFLTQPDE
jgi:hydrogenase expression/formation protein HypE